MTNEIITPELMRQVRHFFEKEETLKASSITFEIQDDGNCLMIYIPIDELPKNEPSSTFKRIGHVLNDLIPGRHGDYSWFATFTRGGEIVDSYFGGNLDSPNSGL